MTLITTMGTARLAIWALTNATPSISGMTRSHVTTSGSSSSTITRASTPLRAVPTTSRKGLRDSNLPDGLPDIRRIIDHQDPEHPVQLPLLSPDVDKCATDLDELEIVS
jgi:hypothetical protein